MCPLRSLLNAKWPYIHIIPPSSSSPHNIIIIITLLLLLLFIISFFFSFFLKTYDKNNYLNDSLSQHAALLLVLVKK